MPESEILLAKQRFDSIKVISIRFGKPQVNGRLIRQPIGHRWIHNRQVDVAVRKLVHIANFLFDQIPPNSPMSDHGRRIDAGRNEGDSHSFTTWIGHHEALEHRPQYILFDGVY